VKNKNCYPVVAGVVVLGVAAAGVAAVGDVADVVGGKFW
jgi:hypothetical protein